MGGIDLAVVAAYFCAIIGFGAYAARHSRGLKDFVLGGQRFAWWLVAFSCVATVVGSYSFVKYSAAGFRYGISSSQTYFNDWFWMPLWMFGWLPIVYYARITSVPEYFERRFGPSVRMVAMVLLLLYLLGYLGINFFTMGRALEALVGWPLLVSAGLAAVICGVYTSHGGQTAVIFTDLVQGALLIVAGLGLFAIGVYQVGGPIAFWHALAPAQRQPLAAFNSPADFNFVGIFWQDGMAGGIAFYFMNQGILLRFLAARSIGHARRAAVAVLLVLMPLAAVAVSGAGWLGRAMVGLGLLPAETPASSVFVAVAERVLPVGLLGLVIAALIAALMSTADTLINAIATIWVVDFWRPLQRRRRAPAGESSAPSIEESIDSELQRRRRAPAGENSAPSIEESIDSELQRRRRAAADERRTLRAARWASAGATAVGLALVPIFASFQSIYRAHGTFTAAVTPPLAVALVFAFCSRRASPRAVMLVMLGGVGLIGLSFAWPELIRPFAHGIDLDSGTKGYSYIRALYGLVVCSMLALAGRLAWPLASPAPGVLTLGSVMEKMRAFKDGAEPRPGPGPRRALRLALLSEAEASPVGEEREIVVVGRADAAALELAEGDLAEICERHWLRGGYNGWTAHVIIGDAAESEIRVSPSTAGRLRLREGTPLAARRVL